jgi:hypothetical protein
MYVKQSKITILKHFAFLNIKTLSMSVIINKHDYILRFLPTQQITALDIWWELRSDCPFFFTEQKQ